MYKYGRHSGEVSGAGLIIFMVVCFLLGVITALVIMEFQGDTPVKARSSNAVRLDDEVSARQGAQGEAAAIFVGPAAAKRNRRLALNDVNAPPLLREFLLGLMIAVLHAVLADLLDNGQLSVAALVGLGLAFVLLILTAIMVRLFDDGWCALITAMAFAAIGALTQVLLKVSRRFRQPAGHSGSYNA